MWRSRSFHRHSQQIPNGSARFDSEARVLASLNHPHIGAIYGLEETDHIPALVLELVDARRLPIASSADRSRSPTVWP
jgi:serine/threonine protein kinase